MHLLYLTLAFLAIAGIAAAFDIAFVHKAPIIGIDLERLGAAIDAVENTPTGRGLNGERTIHQLTKAVWEQHTNLDWDDAESHPHVAKYVQEHHLIWIASQLTKLGLKNRPYSYALVYKAGYGRVLAQKERPADRDYAERVANCYEAFLDQ